MGGPAPEVGRGNSEVGGGSEGVGRRSDRYEEGDVMDDFEGVEEEIELYSLY